MLGYLGIKTVYPFSPFEPVVANSTCDEYSRSQSNSIFDRFRGRHCE